MIVDSGSKDGTVEYASGFGGCVRAIRIERFSHGRARNLGVRNTHGDFVVFVSQDAVPRDNAWLAELLEPFRDPEVAAAFSRQVPRPVPGEGEARRQVDGRRRLADAALLVCKRKDLRHRASLCTMFHVKHYTWRGAICKKNFH